MTILLVTLEIRTKEKSLGAYIFPLVFSVQLISLLGSHIPVLDQSIMKMPLLSFHALTTVIGYSFFLYSFILAIMYLSMLKKFEHRQFDSLFFGMPPLDLLERLNLITLIAGFLLLSLGLASGAWLSLLIWNRIPFTDPKIFLTICLWLICLISLMARSIFRLRGKIMSYVSIAGVAIITLIIVLESLTRSTLHRF